LISVVSGGTLALPIAQGFGKMEEDEARCMALAQPLLRDLHEAWHAAFAMYRVKYPEEVIAEHDDITTANCIRSHLWTDILRRFGERPGCALLAIRNLKILNYRDELVFRFKKVNGEGRHHNYQTKQQMDFDDQLPLPGIPSAATRLTSGYQPDAIGDVIERIIVSRPMGTRTTWAAQVNVIGDTASWVDITPVRLAGTERIDFHPRRRRRPSR
jgi:hypothetical protein